MNIGYDWKQILKLDLFFEVCIIWTDSLPFRCFRHCPPYFIIICITDTMSKKQKFYVLCTGMYFIYYYYNNNIPKAIPLRGISNVSICTHIYSEDEGSWLIYTELTSLKFDKFHNTVMSKITTRNCTTIAIILFLEVIFRLSWDSNMYALQSFWINISFFFKFGLII